jgi:hypothetical protein
MPQLKEVKTLLKKLGKHKASVSCLYINKIEDIDTDVLKQIISLGFKKMGEMYPG